MNKCPICKSSWQGDPIPENLRHHYGNSTHWERQIGIDGGHMGIYDGIVAYQCPDCNEYVPRGNSTWALEMFAKFKAALNEG